MEEFKIQVIYTLNGIGPKEIELTCPEHPIRYNVEQFILESIFEIENPTFTSMYSAIPAIQRGDPRTKASTHAELMRQHGITDLTYEVDGITRSISP